MRHTHAGWGSLLALVLGVTLPVRAGAQAGAYVAQPARVEATVSTWGGDCGARPQSYTTSESPKVEVRTQGTHLALVYPDRTLRTDACWSPNPTVKLASTSAADNRWRTECRTPQGEVRRESGRYTVSAPSAGVLELVEESDYDWRLNESHCVAKVRITQRLERARQGTPVEAPPCVPGKAVRLRLRPMEARLEPGGRVCFQPRAFDQEGCSMDVPQQALRWELSKPAAARGTLAGGCFRAADAAAESEGNFRVLAHGEGLTGEALVTVAAPDLSDITARRSANTPSTPAASAPILGGGLAGAGMTAVGVERKTGWAPFALLGLLGLAVMAGLVLVVRGRSRKASPRKTVRDDAPSLPAAPSIAPATEPARTATPVLPEPPASAPSEAGVASSNEALICPTCRLGFAPGTTRCSADGTALVSYSEWRARKTESAARACPACGAALMPGAAFCGVCGQRLQA